MKEAEYAAASIASFFAGSKRDQPNPFADYQRVCDRGQDSVQELIDAFWQHPYAFKLLAHHRYPEDVIHMFAGRVYEETPLPGLVAMRAINDKGRNQRVAHECPGSLN